MDKPLVPDVIERFGARSTNLQTFKVEDMYMAGQTVRESLAEMASLIISTSTCLVSFEFVFSRISDSATDAIFSSLSTSPSIETI